MSKPAHYPLPCNDLDVPFWRLNLFGIHNLRGYAQWQASCAMDRCIPVLQWLLDHGGFPV